MGNTKYMLITVEERDIWTDVFDTFEEANHKMTNHLGEIVLYDELDGIDTEEKLESVFREEYFKGCEFEYNKNEAWATAHNCNYDWKIVPVTF